MCGFVGFLDGSHSVDAGWLGRTVQSMADVLRHRGPDDDGVWVHAEEGLALGHRRLSIIDTSPTTRDMDFRSPASDVCVGNIVDWYCRAAILTTLMITRLAGSGKRFIL